MSYVTPPTFVDGNVLSATQLNTLSANQEWLYEQAARVNVPQEPMILSVGDGANGEIRRVLRHKFNTLEYDIRCTSGTIDDMSIRYDSTTLYSDGTDRNNPYTWSGTIDLTSNGFTLGQVYTVRVLISGEPGSGTNNIEVITLQEISS